MNRPTGVREATKGGLLGYRLVTSSWSRGLPTIQASRSPSAKYRTSRTNVKAI